MSIEDFGTYPTRSGEFNRHWKIVKVHRVNMSGGGNYKHVFKINYNKVVTNDRWSLEYAAPYSHVFMPIIRSFPVTANIRDPPIIFRRITSAPVCVNFTGHKTYKFRPMISNQPLNYATRNMEAMV